MVHKIFVNMRFQKMIYCMQSYLHLQKIISMTQTDDL